MEKRNNEKGQWLYGVIDKHAGFYKCPVEKDSRSLMNVVFRLPSEQLEDAFVKQGKAAGFVGMKGHRSVGGIRISMYNAIGPEVIKELVRYMEDFVKQNG
jgi:phosphoserine aminotransferase